MATIAAEASPARTDGHTRSGLRWLLNGLAHGYIWAWMAVFALPFVATLTYSLRTPQGEWTLSAYQYVFGSFRDNLLLSFQTTILTIIINLVMFPLGERMVSVRKYRPPTFSSITNSTDTGLTHSQLTVSISRHE